MVSPIENFAQVLYLSDMNRVYSVDCALPGEQCAGEWPPGGDATLASPCALP